MIPNFRSFRSILNGFWDKYFRPLQKSAKNCFLLLVTFRKVKRSSDLDVAQLNVMGHMYTKFECCNFNIHWDLLRTKLQNIFRFLRFVTLKKVQRSSDLDLAPLWVMGHKYTKFEVCNLNIHWDMVRTRFGDARRRRPTQAITITTQSFDCGLKSNNHQQLFPLY